MSKGLKWALVLGGIGAVAWFVFFRTGTVSSSSEANAPRESLRDRFGHLTVVGAKVS